MFSFSYNVFRIFYFPILNWILPLVSKKIKARILFEKNEGIENQSFKINNIEADFAFEVSSEGELEQIRPIIDKVINENKKVELIYCSESVDHKCQQIYKKNPENVRILKLPLISYNPFSTQRCPQKWLTAKKFYLCRYDFFPELIIYGRQNEVEFTLLWATLKNTSNNIFQKAYHSFVYKSFNKIVTATKLDRELFLQKFQVDQSCIENFDFRPWQIISRQQNSLKTLKSIFPCFDEFQKLLENFPLRKRIIFGSFWEYELEVFKNSEILIENGLFVSIVCHKLDEANILSIKNILSNKHNQVVYCIDSSQSIDEVKEIFQKLKTKPGILMINLKGVLCELYTLFGNSFVGGGHGVSVHSLMEPFLAQSIVYCGPKVHRSTEYDLIKESHPDKLHIIDEFQELFPLINKYETLKYSDIEGFKSYYKDHFDYILNWIKVN